MPVILGSLEAEMRKIEFLSQPRQTVHEILSQKYPTKRAGREAQVIEFLPRNYEALSSNPSTTKKRKKDNSQIINTQVYGF
jgi:hypothetical protein